MDEVSLAEWRVMVGRAGVWQRGNMRVARGPSVPPPHHMARVLLATIGIAALMGGCPVLDLTPATFYVCIYRQIRVSSKHGLLGYSAMRLARGDRIQTRALQEPSTDQASLTGNESSGICHRFSEIIIHRAAV